MGYSETEKTVGREVIDPRENPTMETEVYLADGTVDRGAIPSGASIGEFEALELRDGDKDHSEDKGVGRAVRSISTIIHDTVEGMDVPDIYGVDQAMTRADGTEDKSELGASVVLAVSATATRAASIPLGIPLYCFLGGMNGNGMPVLAMNILNGGAHAANTVGAQESMIMPAGAPDFREGPRQCMGVSHVLAALLKEKGFAASADDKGGLAPDLASDEEAIQFILEAVRKVGYEPGKDFTLAMGTTSNKWESGTEGQYILPKNKKRLSSGKLAAHWKELYERYLICSVESRLDEEDWEGWQLVTRELSGRAQLVGDDLSTTNTARLKKGISVGCANFVLIKLSQIGSMLEMLETIKMVHRVGYMAIASHRSEETEDTAIVNLAVALNTCQIRTGVPSRNERVARHNQLLRIEEELGDSAVYPEMETFNELNDNDGGR